MEQYGRIITEQDTVFKRLSTGARESYDLTNWLLFLAIFLFVADVAMRRFQFVPKIVQGRFHGRSAKREKTVENTPQDTLYALNVDMTAEDLTDKDSLKNSEKKRREPKKSKKKQQSEQTLDTSQLLKKKDDRSI